MSKRQWLILIGVWVMLFLFIGLPSSWENVLSVVTGLLICFVAYQFGPGISTEDELEVSKPYVEHKSVVSKLPVEEKVVIKEGVVEMVKEKELVKDIISDDSAIQ